MQGQRSGIGSFPGALSHEHGSPSSDAGIDQQLRWNTMQSSAHNIQPRYISQGQNLSGWHAGESSSNWTENVNNHHERKAESGWSSQMIAYGAVGPVLEQQQYEPDNVLTLNNATINHSSNLIPNTPLFVQNSSNAISQDLNMTAGFEEGNDDLQMMDWSDEPEVSQFPFASTSSDSFGVPSESNAFFLEENDARPTHPLDSRRSSCKRKVIDRNTGQSSISGSSSCFQQAESTGWHSVSGRYSAGSSLRISTSSGNIVATSESPVALNLARSTERAQRNYRGRISPSRHQESIPIDVLPTGNMVGHSNVTSQQQSRLVPPNNSLQMRALSAPDNSSSQVQSSVVHVPAFRPFPRLSRSNGGFLLSGSHASSSGDAVPHEESNSSSVLRNISEHPMFIPPTDISNSLESSTSWGISAGNTSIAGNVASTSRIGSGSRIHQFSGSNRVPHRSPPLYPRRLSLSDFAPPRFISSTDAASGGPSNSHSSSQEMELPSGEGNHGHSLSRSRGAISLDRQLEGALGMPHSLRTFAAAGEGRSRLVSEIRGVLDLMRRGEGLRYEDVMILDQSVFFGMGHYTDRHRDMRLDVDNMSYEELLALEERIGNVSTGLSEEKILKGLKQWKYYSIRVVSQLEREPCCVCQEEYNDGENIGTLGCGHEFHANCIKQWLMHKNLCPICKTTAMNT